MVVSLPQLATELNKIAPTRLVKFNKPQSLPFIIYKRDIPDDFHADDEIYNRNQIVDVELYTKNVDFAREGQIENLFKNNEIPYEITMLNEYVKSEGFFMTVYSISILGG